MTAMSPRTPAPRLRSTNLDKWGSPRQTESKLQKISLARGYTIKAGAPRRARLQKGISPK